MIWEADRLDCFIFDLDNTLYPASCSLFPQIDQRMKRFISETLGLAQDEAHRLQKRYYLDYGTTLRGLMLVHGLEPEAFLAYVHDIDHSVLSPSPRLAAALTALPGRKLVHTNGSEKHAVNVLDRLGLADQFEAIFDIRAAGYLPKPDAESYLELARRHRVEPARAAMFEDLARNLVPARKLGMTTVLVQEDGHRHGPQTGPGDMDHVDHVTEDLAGFLERVAIPR